MGERARRPMWRYAAVLALVLSDLWSKRAVFAWLGPIEHELPQDLHGHARLTLAGEWLSFMLSENRGAAFGRFGEWPWVLVLGRVAAVIALALLLHRTERRTPSYAFAACEGTCTVSSVCRTAASISFCVRAIGAGVTSACRTTRASAMTPHTATSTGRSCRA